MSDNPVRILGIDHAVLRVRDVERAIRFYCDVLGCTVERRNEKIGLVHLRAGRSMIDLADVAGEVGRRAGPPPGRDGHNMDHVALRIENFDAAALRRHLERHGVAAGEPRPRFGADGEGPSIYIEDPEGNMIELKGPPTR
jgi:catechol 2,3-dioxygenase-like lactoylglutathione lyase family enzyme